ncbi:hypothetical protein OQA88_8162 [Cercophora sp. LCS_1]
MLSLSRLAIAASFLPQVLGADWSGWGANIHNNRWVPSDTTTVTGESITTLTHFCTISYPIGASATPVIKDDTAYFPTWDGTLTAINYKTCRMIWQINIAELIAGYAPTSPAQASVMPAVARTSPQIHGDILFFGTQIHALVVALNRTNALTLDIIQLSPHPFAAITQSPTFYDGKLFVGTSSYEHIAALDAEYPCCSFHGTFAALEFDAETGFSVAWNLSTIPEARVSQGWAGASVWGSQPSIDEARRRVFVGTGNAYVVPADVRICQRWNNLTAFVSNAHDPCLPGDVWQDSVVAVDIDTGKVAWAFQTPGVDAYVAACGYPGLAEVDEKLCPQVPGPDADFGMAPAFVPERDLLVVGRKNGHLYSLLAENGTVAWESRVGQGGIGGGLAWGVAVDEVAVYYAVINTGYLEWRLTPSNITVNASAYGAASLDDGRILWQTAVPRGGVCHAPPTVVGDLVLVARTGQVTRENTAYDETKGGLVALNKRIGRVALDYDLPSNAHSGIAVQGEYVLLGTGYRRPSPEAAVLGGFHVLTVDPAIVG